VKIFPWLIILLIHIILSILLLIFIFNKKSTLRKENIIPTFLVPIFGPLAGFVVEWINRSGNEGTDIDLIMPLVEESDILWETFKHEDETGDVIPLEEALIIDELEVRRRIMLKALYDDPMKYLDVLRVAAQNSDTETAHYATTTISHEQRKFQLEIQKVSAAYESSPDDLDLLDAYIEEIENFIESGLLEKYLLQNQRIAYDLALKKRLELDPYDQTTIIKHLRNSLKLKEYGTAFHLTDILQENWPDEEATWIETLRVCVDGKDQKRLADTVEKIRSKNILWTPKGNEQIRFWMEGVV
jgi:hypothetical protein